MSFSGRTPESILPRSDSKNPATTCKGITANGRPCRRPLASNSPAPSPSRGNGVLAVLNETDAAAFYCWQHKDQAENLAQRADQHTTLYPLQERTSIDTLIDRVGIINLDEEIQPPKKVHRKKRSGKYSITPRETLPSGWHDIQSPLMTVPEEIKQEQHYRRRKHKSGSGRSNVKFSWACCIRADDSDDDRPPRYHDTRPPQSSQQPQQMTYESQTQPITPARRKPISTLPAPAQSPSQTQHLLSIIPSALSPQITSSLLAELSRPISPHDEAGYIYIFWLTPDSDTSPDDETASSLMDDEDLRSPIHSGRREAAIQRYASIRRPSNVTAPPKKTVMLKIGRAQNVHRRMSQWSKQCGQNISLIRYYPYDGKGGGGDAGQKVPNVVRVERLIHLELGDKKAIKDECEQCEREHREWFEVEASREGLRGVDECVRRWVGWSLGQGRVETGGREESGKQNAKRDGRRGCDDVEQTREDSINAKAWQNADRIRDDAWRDTGQAPAARQSSGNELGGYY